MLPPKVERLARYGVLPRTRPSVLGTARARRTRRGSQSPDTDDLRRSRHPAVKSPRRVGDEQSSFVWNSGRSQMQGPVRPPADSVGGEARPASLINRLTTAKLIRDVRVNAVQVDDLTGTGVTMYCQHGSYSRFVEGRRRVFTSPSEGDRAVCPLGSLGNNTGGADS